MRKMPTAILLLVSACGAIVDVAAGQIRDERQFDTLIAPAVAATTAEPKAKPELDRVAERIHTSLNRFRTRRELSPLEANQRLSQTAADFATFMATNNEYGHQADGRQPSERVSQHGYEFCIVLENIGWAKKSTGFTSSELARQFHRGWRESPEHRKNMADPDVTEVGIGVAHSEESGRYYAVQLFGRPKSLQIEFRVENRVEETVHYSVDSQHFSLEPDYIRKHAMCRPPQVTFSRDAAASGQSPPDRKTYHVQDGDRFVVQRVGPTLEIVRSPGGGNREPRE